jgi:hypothetical protein
LVARSRRLVLAIAAAAAPIAIGALLGGCGSSPSSAGPTTRQIPLESIFEADQQLDADPAGTLALMRRLGVDRVRVFVPWGGLGSRMPLAPNAFSRVWPRNFDATNPAAYPRAAWATYDAIVRDAAASGVALDLTVSSPAPLWATQPGEPAGGPTGVWKPSARAYGQFMQAVGTRYSGRYPDPLHPGKRLPRVAFWGIWNEPNLGIDLAPQAIENGRLEVSPVFYRRLVDAAWSALRATGHGRDTILIGELAPRGSTVGNVPGNFDMMVPLRFLRTLYCVDSSYRPLRGAAAAARGCPTTAATSSRFVAEHPALFHASGIADHPYPQGLAPNVLTPLEPDFADFAALPRLERALDRLQAAYGSSTRFPVYSTEFGYQTNPPERLIRAIPAQRAAYYMNWAEYLSWRDPRIRSYDQYLLTDAPSGNFSTGLESAGAALKATYYAYRMPLYVPVSTATRGQKLEVWGCVRPAHHAGHRPPPVEIQFAPSGARFHTVRTVGLSDRYGYFDVRQGFAVSGTVRLRWSYPHGPTIFSRNAVITVR